MASTDPQLLYMILVLPSLFGLTLLGEGIAKMAHSDWSGIISFMFGLAFIAVVIFAFVFFSIYINNLT